MMTYLRRVVFVPFLMIALAPVTARADDAIPGKIVVARTTGSAIVLYDASAEVAAIVKDRVPDATANDRLERAALRVLAKETTLLGSASAVTIRITYTLTGDVSPVYGSATFAGIERYANVTMPIGNVKLDRGKWREAASGYGALPGGITFEIVGKLPPRSN